MASRIVVGSVLALSFVAAVVASRSIATSPGTPVEQETLFRRSAEAVGDQEGVSETAQRRFGSLEERMNYVKNHPEEMRQQAEAAGRLDR